MFPIKTLFVSVIALAAFTLPSTASAACNVGISNNLDTVPPAALFQGATENQSYSVSSCTIPDRITVEWVMVKDSTKSWIDDPANRTAMIAETSMGRQMQGATSWTAPSNTQPGHYAVITRYYAQGQNYAEATATSSFTVKPDVCSNVAGGQDTIPAGLVSDGSGSCVEPDLCPNLVGTQTSLPVGLTINANGDCTLMLQPTGTAPQPLAPTPAITKTANRKTVTTGQGVIYTLSLRNTGRGAMLNVKMCDKIPAGSTYVSNSGRARFSNGSICWSIPRLAPGARMSAKLTLKVAKTYKGRTLVNTVCASSSNASRVCARATVRVVRAYTPQPAGGVTG